MNVARNPKPSTLRGAGPMEQWSAPPSTSPVPVVVGVPATHVPFGAHSSPAPQLVGVHAPVVGTQRPSVVHVSFAGQSAFVAHPCAMTHVPLSQTPSCGHCASDVQPPVTMMVWLANCILGLRC